MTDETSRRTDPTFSHYTKLEVSVTKGPDAGASCELSYLPVRVGTSTECDLVLSDASVATRHCTLESAADGVRVRDEGSDGGVFLGDVRVFDLVAPLPAQISLGGVLLLVKSSSESVSRARAARESFGDLLGRSARMRELFEELTNIATTSGSVFIEAERGTGRQLVAESIHDASPRTDGPFVVIDCSDPARAPTESDLLGHEGGTFDRASEANRGAFERANSGDLYLHEVGSLPQPLQLEVERVLQTGEVRRLGARSGIPVNVRLLSSSSKNLAEEVRRGHFRRELLAGLGHSHVRIPALRDRIEDLPLLVEHFIGRSSGSGRPYDVPAAVWEMFAAYRWPGNVRELLSAVQALVLDRSRELQSKPARVLTTDAPIAGAPRASVEPLRLARRAARDQFERDYVHALLTRTQGNVTRAAAIAEVSRQMMQKLLRKYRAE